MHECNFDGCTATFVRQSDVERHKAAVHEQEAWNCTICANKYSRKDTLRNHMRKVHVPTVDSEQAPQEQATWNCGICGNKYSRKDKLRDHMRKVHVPIVDPEQAPQEQETLSCRICGNKYSRKDKLRNHMRKVHVPTVDPEHTPQEQDTWTCGICGNKYSRKNKLDNHMRKAHVPTVDPDNDQPLLPPKRPRPTRAWKVIQKKRAFKDAVISFEVEGEGTDPYIYLLNLAPDIRAETEQLLESETGLKISMNLQVEFYKPADSSVRQKNYFWCKQNVVTRGENVEEVVESCFPQILKGIDEHTKEGSGWAIQRIVSSEIHFVRYRPLRGAAHIPLPPYIQHKRAVVNVTNGDNKCFLWSIIASHPRFEHLVHREAVGVYRPYEEDYDMTGIRLPVEVDQISRFEAQNDMTINVYGFEGDDVFFPVRISKGSGAHHINLLLYENHYFWIRNMDRMLGDQRRHTNRKHFCHKCLFPFYSQERLDEHIPLCGSTTKIEMPEKESIKFENTHRMLKQPVVVYADFECLLEPMESEDDEQRGATEKYQRHVPCGYGLLEARSCCRSAEFEPYEGYRGPDCVRKFLLNLEQIGLSYQERLDNPEPLVMSEDDDHHHQSTNECHVCKKTISDCADKVRDHCHLCGKYRGPAHNSCNQALRLSRDIVVVFHNMRRYDGHLLMNELGTLCKEMDKEMTCIAKTMEDYLSIRIHTPKSKEEETEGWSIKFIDSFQFLSSSLDSLVKSTPETEFKALEKEFLDISLLLKKGAYPYDYMDSPQRFQETELPPKESFFNKLNNEHISDEFYAHARRIWEHFEIRNLGEYHDHYLKSDTCQLADVIEQFRAVCLENYGLDPMHYITLPAFGWDSCLKVTDVVLETIQDPDIYSFLEAGIRGGVSVISHRHAKANNPRCRDYDPSKPTSHLMYWDANNLYGWAMIQKLPTHGFRWIPPDSNIDWAHTSGGYILEADLEYPSHLHDRHNDYPLAPEKIPVPDLSPYCQGLKDEFGLGKSAPKLIPNLNPKEKYIVHIRNLQQYLSLGMVLKKVHRVLAFEESAWMEPYIMLNTRLRTAATSELAKSLFKLMNNAVFGKTMENVRAYQEVKLVWDQAKLEKLTASPRFKRAVIFSPDLVGVAMTRTTTVLDKPIYCGFVVLDGSKTLMYDFHYLYILPKYGEKAKLLFTDTDSFIYLIETPDIYADMEEDQRLFDTSDYPQDHPLHSMTNKKVIGKMKDELAGKIMYEFCGLRSKMYSFDSEVGEKARAKGIKKSVVKQIPFQSYVEALFMQTRFKHRMNLIRSEKHQIYSTTLQKASLTPYDDKRYILEDGVQTLAYGHIDIDMMDFE